MTQHPVGSRASREDINDRIALQKKRHSQCSIPGCFKHSDRIGSLCENHAGRAARYGAPEARPIRRQLLEAHAKKAQTVIFRNHSHAAVKAAVAHIKGLLAEGQFRTNVRGEENSVMRALAALETNGTDPVDILANLVAVYILLERKLLVPTTPREEFFAVVAAFFTFPPNTRRLGFVRVHQRGIGALVRVKFHGELMGTIGPIVRALAKKATLLETLNPARDVEKMLAEGADLS